MYVPAIKRRGLPSGELRIIDIFPVQFCPTYPARLAVPTRISDTTLAYAAKYRSKARIPALVYLHWANYVCDTDLI
jgi:hypothetical protein